MKKPRKLLWFSGLASAALVAGLLFYTTTHRAQADFDPTHVTRVERGTMVRSVVATGKIEPITKVEIKSKANGIIKSLHVNVGNWVQPGDILAELDKENLQARVRAAQANVQAAKAALGLTRAELKKNLVEAEGPDVPYFRRTLDRAQVLFNQKLIAQSDLDKANSDLEMAENRRLAARAQLEITRAKILEAEAQVAQATAAGESAEEDLANATIRAPIVATVLTRDVEIGSPVSSILNMGAAATLVMVLGDVNRVFVRGKVDEADIGRVRMGQPARITVETFRDRVFGGKVTQISPIGAEKDNVTNFEVRVSIDNPGKELKANMTANAEIVLEELPDALIIPIAAVIYDAHKSAFVEVPAPTSPKGRERIPVKLGIGNGTRTQVIEGLLAGDRVILP
jgi:HlyD family secretion protein